MWDRFSYVTEPPPAGTEAKAAVLAPLFEDAQGRIRLLLTKRPMTMPTHAGHLAFPGGRPDPSDDGPVATALRETHEEVGIKPADVEVLGFLPPVDTVSFSLMVVPVVGRLQPEPQITPDPWEVDRIYTPLVSHLADPTAWRHEIWQGRTVWFFDIEGDVLWGATAWMTRRLLGMDIG
jgi:8-oxo-dGTP pyrophosphatase MutT (NUDIX family)